MIYGWLIIIAGIIASLFFPLPEEVTTAVFLVAIVVMLDDTCQKVKRIDKKIDKLLSKQSIKKESKIDL